MVQSAQQGGLGVILAALSVDMEVYGIREPATVNVAVTVAIGT